MPLREFKCAAGHTAEKILNGEADRTTTAIFCPELVNWVTDDGGQIIVRKLPCGLHAERVEWSRVAPAQFIEGVGGFHKPTVSAIPYRDHNTRATQEFIKEHRTAETVYKQVKK